MIDNKTDEQRDPVWDALMVAPLDDEPDTPEELAAMEAGKNGPFIPHAEVVQRLASRRVPDDHPAVQAMTRAPVVPGRPSDEEREAVAAATAGPWIPHEQVMAEVEARRPRDPEANARLDATFAAAPPEWQEFFSELDRRDPKMR